MTPADLLKRHVDHPVLAEPHRESRDLARRLLVRHAVIAGALGFLAAAAHALRVRGWEEGFLIAGAIVIVLLAPLTTVAAMGALLRRRFARVAESGQHEELRTIPGVPTPLLPYYAIAVQEPMKTASLKTPLFSAVAFMGLYVLGALCWRVHVYSFLALIGFLAAALGYAVVGLSYVPMLFFSGPLGHAIQVIGRYGCRPSTWEHEWDDEWERATRLSLIGNKILRTDVRVLAVAVPIVVVVGGAGLAVVAWIIQRFPGRDQDLALVLAVGAVLLLVGFLLAVARRASRQKK